MSFGKLIEEYQRHDRYARLAPSTKKIYRRHLEYLGDVLGDFPVAKFRRHHAADMRAALHDQPNLANARQAILSALLEVATELGWVDRNYLKGAPYYQPARKHALAWPVDLQERFRAEVDGSTRLFFELALWTAQRAGDVLAMKWADLEGDCIRVRQQKTKVRLLLPLSGELLTMLGGMKRESLFLVHDDGRPVSYNAMHRRFRKVLRGLDADAYAIHGLRATRAQELSAAGLTDEQIMSVTGHKRQASLKGYTADVRQIARARDAMKGKDGG